MLKTVYFDAHHRHKWQCFRIRLVDKDLMQFPFQTMKQYEKFNAYMLKHGMYGLIGKFDEFYVDFSFMETKGGYIFSKNADCTYNENDMGLVSDEALQGLQEIVDYTKKYVPKSILTMGDWSSINQFFCDGKAAAIITGPWALSILSKCGVNLGYAPFPKSFDGKPLKSFLSTKGYSIPKVSKHPKIAKEFLELVTRPRYALYRYSATNELPPLKHLFLASLINHDPFANALITQFKHTVEMPTQKKFGKSWKGLDKALNKVLVENAPLESTFKEAFESLNQE